MSQRVYLFASSLLAACPAISVEHALRLAVKILGVCEEVEQLKYIAELWESLHECR